jgi:hypothetical protein
MFIAALFILVVGLPVLFYSFRMFDRIVRAEYEVNRIAWEQDGKPRGFFWSAPECTLARSGWAMNRLSFVWLFKTPSWAAESTDCKAFLKRLRISVLAWNVLIVISTCILILSY